MKIIIRIAYIALLVAIGGFLGAQTTKPLTRALTSPLTSPLVGDYPAEAIDWYELQTGNHILLQDGTHLKTYSP